VEGLDRLAWQFKSQLWRFDEVRGAPFLAYVCQLTGVHDANLKGADPLTEHPRGPQPCSSGSGGTGVRTVIVEDLEGRQMAWQRRVLPAKF
jgi:hypothetical protein